MNHERSVNVYLGNLVNLGNNDFINKFLWRNCILELSEYINKYCNKIIALLQNKLAEITILDS